MSNLQAAQLSGLEISSVPANRKAQDRIRRFLDAELCARLIAIERAQVQ